MNEFIQIAKRNNGGSIQKLYELENSVQGYSLVIVSVKKDGDDGLKGSYFIWGTVNGDTPEKELTWDCDNKDFIHNQVLTEFLTTKSQT